MAITNAAKACRTLEQLAELTASRARLHGADIFHENFASRGLEENIYEIVFDIFSSRGKILNVCGRREQLAQPEISTDQ